MHWDRFKLLASLLIVVLMICVSANVIAINQNSEPMEGSTNSKEAVTATVSIDGLTDNTEQDAANNCVQPQECDGVTNQPSSTDETNTHIEINTNDIILKKVSPQEILDQFQLSEGVVKADPSKYLENKPIQPVTIPVDEYHGQVFTPEEVFKEVKKISRKI